MQSDHGGEFCNKDMKQVLKSNKIRHQVSLSHQPESQGSIERFNGSLKRIIMSYFTTNNNSIWYDILDDLLFNYNNSKHAVIKMTPNKAKYQAKLVDKRLKQKAFQNLQLAPKYSQINLGDSVKLSL